MRQTPGLHKTIIRRKSVIGLLYQGEISSSVERRMWPHFLAGGPLIMERFPLKKQVLVGRTAPTLSAPTVIECSVTAVA